MRYCYNCNKITRGEPTFCSFCGRTYNQKLCSRMHPNPRGAQFCSQCGSREFSTPQPLVPVILRPALALLRILPKAFLPATLILLIAFILRLLVTDPYARCRLIVLGLMVGLGWYVWRNLPQIIRNAISKAFQWLFKSSQSRDR